MVVFHGYTGPVPGSAAPACASPSDGKRVEPRMPIASPGPSKWNLPLAAVLPPTPGEASKIIEAFGEDVKNPKGDQGGSLLAQVI